jgi:hypothetical protein
VSGVQPGNDASATVIPIRFQNGTSDLEPSELGVSNRLESYGNGIDATEEKLSLLKLSLLHPDDLPRNPNHLDRVEDIQGVLTKIHAKNITGVQALAEYVRRLWADGCSDLTQSLARQGLNAKNMNVRFVVGVPAVWQDDTVIRMRQAVEGSGVLFTNGKLATADFVPEPELAAMALLPRLRDIKVCATGPDAPSLWRRDLPRPRSATSS